ncbi:MAG: DUF2971 domain-containing protein [Candidatus Binataceae bacterium]
MKLPPQLFRYRPFDIPTEKCLKCGEAADSSGRDQRERVCFAETRLYAPSRTQFNDPFDCLALSFDHIPKADLEAFIDKMTEQAFTEMSPVARQAKAQELKRYSASDLQRTSQEMADYLGILSFSTKPDNLLMWSHYANSHKGFCLEFDTQYEPFDKAWPVAYSLRRPKYELSTDSLKNAQHLVLTKSLDWAYEDEWRVVLPKGGEKYAFPPIALKGVIFGDAMSASSKNKIREWINEGPCSPAVYQAKCTTGDFGLDIEPEP